MSNNLILFNYLNIFIYLIFAIVLSCIILILSYVFAVQTTDSEKMSAYECGFSPFEDARLKFDVKFYLVAILFIIFDLEVSFLFPWVSILGKTAELSYLPMMLFLIILTIGFIYEWVKGALDWS